MIHSTTHYSNPNQCLNILKPTSSIPSFLLCPSLLSSEWDIPEDDIIGICNGNKAAGGSTTGNAGISAFRGTSGPTKKKKFKPTARSAPTAEEEEAWMRQSWSLPQSVSLLAATGGVATAAGEKPPVGRNSQSLTSIKYPNKRASTTGTSGTSTLLQATQEGAAATASTPAPDFTASVVPEETPSRWVQLPDSSQRVGRLLPQQLRDLFKQKGQDVGSHAAVGTTASTTAMGGEKSEKKKKTAAPEDVEAWQNLDAVRIYGNLSFAVISSPFFSPTLSYSSF